MSRDFFISYNHKDEYWAEWIAWQIESFGFTVILQKWDFPIGSNFVAEMDDAIKMAKKIVLVTSTNYFTSEFTKAEWAAYFKLDPVGKNRRLFPIKIDEHLPVGLLAQFVWLDLHLKDEQQCVELLKKAVFNSFEDRAKPVQAPPFPDGSAGATLLKPIFPTKLGFFSIRLTLKPDKRTNQLKEVVVQAFKARKSVLHITERAVGRVFAEKVLPLILDDLRIEKVVFETLSYLVVDIDGMNGINRKFGVNAGDDVLIKLGELCSKVDSRLFSMRIGDDTILIVLNQTEWVNAIRIARVLQSNFNKVIWHQQNMVVTCSIGVAVGPASLGVSRAIYRAVEAQVKARLNGGNQVLLAKSDSSYGTKGIVQETKWQNKVS